MVKVKEDMTGWKMWEHGVPDSRLTVIEQTEDYIFSNGKHIAQWLCECSCKDKTHIVVTGVDLRGGRTKSCGCIQKEKAKIIGEKNKKYNTYQILDEVVIGFDKKKCSFFVSLEDYELIKDYCWYVNTHGYVIARDAKNKKLISMHRLIMNAKDGEIVDHKDRKRNNNIKTNLRLTDSRGNSINRSVKEGKTSGVIWSKKDKKWYAIIKINKKTKYVYYGNNKDDAIKARLEAEAKYYGEFAPQRHLFEEYGITT